MRGLVRMRTSLTSLLQQRTTTNNSEKQRCFTVIDGCFLLFFGRPFLTKSEGSTVSEAGPVAVFLRHYQRDQRRLALARLGWFGCGAPPSPLPACGAREQGGQMLNSRISGEWSERPARRSSCE